MITVILKETDSTKDKKQTHYLRQLYGCTFKMGRNGGCTEAEIIIPIDIVNPHAILETLEIYDNTTFLWFGRVYETPRVTINKQAMIITAIGFINHLLDQSFSYIYSDVSWDKWDTDPGFINWPDANNFNFCTKDNNNRLFIQVNDGDTYPASSLDGIYYAACETTYGTNQPIYSISFDYTIGAGITSACQARLYSYTNTNTGSALEWSLTGNGATQTGSVTDTISASKTALFFCLYASSDMVSSSSTSYMKITNIRVNGHSSFTGTYQADEVIKHILTNYAIHFSMDQTLIANGTYNLAECFFTEPISPLEATKKLNSFEDYNYGVYSYGSDNLPRFEWAAHDLATIDYYTSMKVARPELSGESIEEQFNAVDVSYHDSGDRSVFTTVTATHELLNNYQIANETAGLTRKPDSSLGVDTSSNSMAIQAGNTFLSDKARRQGKAPIVLRGTVTSQNGAMPVTWMRPGKNIMIRDLQATPDDLATMVSSNVLNGKNIFRIESVEIDALNNVATLELDTPGDRLDILLSKKYGWR